MADLVATIVEQDGPRTVARLADGTYIVDCTDCRWQITAHHLVDAQDAVDDHHC